MQNAMNGRRTLRTFGVRALALLSIAPMASSASSAELSPQRCEPGLHTFSININNPFFPLPPDQRWVLVGKEGPNNIGLRITVLQGTATFYPGTSHPIETRRVQETEWEDDDGDGRIDRGEFVIETSINYFAQTEQGTVCYFGEDVNIFHPGGPPSHEGAWRADAPGNGPGIIMPAESDVEVGVTYKQENAPGVAEDTATITAVGRTVKTPAETFTDTIKTRDVNPLDGSKGTKAYARDVGLIQDDVLLLLRFGPQ
jgi:hypothetical protein